MSTFVPELTIIVNFDNQKTVEMVTREELQKLDVTAKPRSEEAVTKAEERKKQREDKDLLFRDLCARLPYGVKCQFEDNLRIIDGESSPFYDYVLSDHHLGIFMRHNNFHIKPYLRPMSSMTEVEKKEYQSLCEIHIEHDADDNVTYYYFDTIESFDWLNKNMFDYRGLIPKSLATAVTKDNNPYTFIRLC